MSVAMVEAILAELEARAGAPEEWRPVAEFDGYEVSSRGQVRSVERVVVTVRSERILHGRLLKPWAQHGYQVVGFSVENAQYRRYVHDLVLTAFVGPRPEGMEACHADGDGTNNDITNLRWDTHAANVQDSLRHGTHTNAAKTHCSHGHEYAPENTRHYGGRRYCRTCQNGGNR